MSEQGLIVSLAAARTVVIIAALIGAAWYLNEKVARIEALSYTPKQEMAAPKPESAASGAPAQLPAKAPQNGVSLAPPPE